MANNYTQLSFCIAGEWPHEAKQDLVDILTAIDAYEISEAPAWYREFIQSEQDGVEDFDFAVYVEDELCGYSQVNSELRNDAEPGKASTLYIYSEESANVEAVLSAIHAVMRHYQIETPTEFQYADTCSKPRVDEFGGGVVRITADGIQSWHTSQGIPTTERVFMDRSYTGMSRLVLALSGDGEKKLAAYIGKLQAAEKQTFWGLLGKGEFRQYRKNTLRNWQFADDVEIKLVTDFCDRLDISLFRYIRFGRDMNDYDIRGEFDDPFKLNFKFTPEREISYVIPE
jgi:hypothetical protein